MKTKSHLPRFDYEKRLTKKWLEIQGEKTSMVIAWFFGPYSSKIIIFLGDIDLIA